MRKLAKLSDGSRALRVWRGLADYANADLASDQKALDVFGYLEPEYHLLDIGEPEDGQTREEMVLHEEIRHQPILKQLLYWLARPEEQTLIFLEDDPNLPPVPPVLFLNNELSDSSLREPDDPEIDGLPVYFERVVKFHSILGPICEFIVDELEGSWERAPVRICEREGCGKFTVPERTGRKKFCSDQCRALSYQGSRTDWNKYMRDYRKTVKSKRKRGKK